jgi:hypothetical protein
VRFEVRNPTGAPHEVELEGTLATIGRDPTCDLVLNDPKCSRRHAVIEAGPDGLVVRDTGSANGIFVNGKKTERSALVEGDVVRLGDASITVLPEDVPGTLVMGPDEIEEVEQAEEIEVVKGDPAETRPDGPLPLPVPLPVPLAPPPRPATGVPEPMVRPPAPSPPVPRPGPTPPAASPVFRPPSPAPPRQPPLPRVSRPPAPVAPRTTTAGRSVPPARGGPSARPFTVSVLAMLWSLSVIVFPLAGFLAARSLDGAGAALAIGVGIFMAVVSGAMAYGMYALAPWARPAQIAIAGIGTIACFHPFSIASAVTLVYMLRPLAKHAFDPAAAPAAPGDATTETIVSGALLAAVVLGVLLTAALTVLARSAQ